MTTNPPKVREDLKDNFSPEKSDVLKNEKFQEQQLPKVDFAGKEALGIDMETIETVGRVSEALKSSQEQDKSSQASGGSTTTKGAVFDHAAIKEKLLNNLPSEKKMISQIEDEIKNEINYLRKKALKMIAGSSNMSYFEMSNLIRKIRELKGILASLMKASLEVLKSLWLRYVHGIMH